MMYYSTNNPKNIVDLQTAVMHAFPADKGLYLPTEIKPFNEDYFKTIGNRSFETVAYDVIKQLIGLAIPEGVLSEIVAEAFNFPCPLIQLEENIHVLELFHGPTMAFKDFGARFMARLISYYIQQSAEKTTILVATSGDTGGAVAAGFYNVPNIDVVILYPKGKVSPLQEKQLTTWGNNIRAVAVEGVFDDCQRLVKSAFIDDDLNRKYSFSSANSINIARLIPQSIYYFEAYRQLDKQLEELVFCVPSGNFGNLTAGILSQKLGLPISQFIAAVNENDTFVKYLKSGEYMAQNSTSTLANAMDVGDPSNFPRLFQLLGSTWNNVKSSIASYSIKDQEIKNQMVETYKQKDYYLDPHGAVGVAAVKKHQSLQGKSPNYIVLETAHPAKFLEVCAKTYPNKLEFPTQLQEFVDKSHQTETLSNSFTDFKSYLLYK